MLKTALNTNIIQHIWKLANIIPIPKPNKDIDKDTSYRHISLLSVIAKTLEKSLFPYITANIPNTPTQHGYTTLYSNDIKHTKQHGSEGVQPNGSPARTITVPLDMSKAFDTINICTHLSESCYITIFLAQSLTSLQTTSRDAKPTQHI